MSRIGRSWFGKLNWTVFGMPLWFDERIFRVGYIEICNEKVCDLLEERKVVPITQNGENEIKLTNKEVPVKEGGTILEILAHRYRMKAQTSHAIFRIVSELLTTSMRVHETESFFFVNRLSSRKIQLDECRCEWVIWTWWIWLDRKKRRTLKHGWKQETRSTKVFCNWHCNQSAEWRPKVCRRTQFQIDLNTTGFAGR